MSPPLLIIALQFSDGGPNDAGFISIGAVAWKDGLRQGEFTVELARSELFSATPHVVPQQSKGARTAENSSLAAAAMGNFELFLVKSFSFKKNKEKIMLCGHNVVSDLDILRCWFRTTGRSLTDIFSSRVLDISSIVQFLVMTHFLPLKNTNFDDCGDYFRINAIINHQGNAIDDARATAALLTAMVNFVRMPESIGGRGPA